MSKPFIIAELSGNHNGEIERAFALMEAAKIAGADAIKLQTYTADTLTIDHDGDDFQIKGGLWANTNLFQLYQTAHTPWEWHADLFAKGKELGIPVFSTPFDETAVDLLESLEAPLYKIASFELIHYPLIAYVARTKKPMIMSTGMSDLSEIGDAVDTAFANGCTDLTLLHCISAYPAPIEDCNLATMLAIKKEFPGVKVGLSDHTLGNTAAIAAVALGAQVIEKHVTLCRADGGVDSAFSLEPEELRQLCVETANAAKAIGRVNFERADSENKNKIFRRSIYVTKPIAAGEAFSSENIRIIRPGYGLHPRFYQQLLGKKSKKKLEKGDRAALEQCED